MAERQKPIRFRFPHRREFHHPGTQDVASKKKEQLQQPLLSWWFEWEQSAWPEDVVVVVEEEEENEEQLWLLSRPFLCETMRECKTDLRLHRHGCDRLVEFLLLA